MCTPTQGVWQPAGCVSCEPVCVCVSLVRVVIICLASTHTALVSSPSLAVLHFSTYLPSAHPGARARGSRSYESEIAVRTTATPLTLPKHSRTIDCVHRRVDAIDWPPSVIVTP